MTVQASIASETQPSTRGFLRSIALHVANPSRVFTILVIAIVTRLVSFGNPIVYTDEEFYFAVGRAMVNGALPFVDIWDRKPIGLFLIYAGPAALPGITGIWLYQLLALASAAGTAAVIARLADLAGWNRGGTLAGVAYLVWITIAGGQGGQSPVFYNLLMALAAFFVVSGNPQSRWRGALTMLLVGLAMQIKYTVILEGIYFGLTLMLAEWRRARRVSAVLIWGATLVMIALVPTIVAMGVYADRGALSAFVFANFESIFGRNPDPAREQFINLVKATAILLPLLGMAVGARTIGSEKHNPALFFLSGWLVAALLAFAIIPPWPDHYTLPVILPGAVMAAGLLSRPHARRAAIWLILVAAVVGQASLLLDLQRRGTPGQFAAVAQSIGTGRGCLYVYSSSSMLYPATGRCAVSSYVFPSHLTRERENGSIGVDQMTELRAIFARAPEIVVMGPPYDGERRDIRREALRLIGSNYVFSAEMPLGRKRIGIYRRSKIPFAVGGVTNFGTPQTLIRRTS